jgi:hypothetical protein
MAPKPLTYKERDVRQAINALGRAGLPVKLLEIDKDGKISLHVGVPQAKCCGDSETSGETNEWDEVLDQIDPLKDGE